MNSHCASTYEMRRAGRFNFYFRRQLCIAGENACPPEDVGGAMGYEEFLEALADPSHPEHEDRKDWIGGSFDPTAFDIGQVNRRLAQTEN